MAKRTLSWHTKEDALLLSLLEEENLFGKWTVVAKRMEEAGWRSRKADHYKTRGRQLLLDRARNAMFRPLSEVEMLAAHRPWK